MPTFNQLVRKGRKSLEKKSTAPALLKSYNHQWLEQQSVATRERINGMLRRYKLQFVGMEIDSNFRIGNQVQIDFDNLGEFIEIPLFKNNEKEVERE